MTNNQNSDTDSDNAKIKKGEANTTDNTTSSMPTIIFEGERAVKAKKNETILDASLNAGIPHTHACGGNARCSTCRVWVVEGEQNICSMNEDEGEIARLRKFSKEIRLACQAKVTGDITVKRLVKDEEDLTLIETEIHTHHHSSGEEKNIAVFFSDLRGFTSFSEEHPAYDVVHILNKYFHRVCPIIKEYNGTIDKFMGDGIMALFGLENDTNPVLSAVTSALLQIQALDEFNVHLEQSYGVRLKLGIGIHYGRAIIGNLGYGESMSYTAIGDTVNMAARIESANKDAGTLLLISQDAYDQVKNKVITGTITELSLKGKIGTFMLYEVVGLKC